MSHFIIHRIRRPQRHTSRQRQSMMLSFIQVDYFATVYTRRRLQISVVVWGKRVCGSVLLE
jgi:hypothetical protein